MEAQDARKFVTGSLGRRTAAERPQREARERCLLLSLRRARASMERAGEEVQDVWSASMERAGADPKKRNEGAVGFGAPPRSARARSLRSET